MDYREFSGKIRQKYPGAYDDLDDRSLAQKMVQKYPEYADVTFDAPTQKIGSFGMNMVENAAKQTPLGMASQGAESFMTGFGKVMNALPISVGPTVKDVASTLDIPRRVFRSVGVGIANAPQSLIPGGAPTAQNVMASIPRMAAAVKPGFKPANPAEQVGSIIGESLPFFASGAAPLGWQGPLLAAQSGAAQATETGEMSPVGVGLPLVAQATPTIFKAAKDVAGWTGKKMLSAALGPETGAIEARLKNPAALENALTREQLTARLPQDAQKLSTQIADADRKAWESLRKSYDPYEGAMAKEDVIGALKRAKDQLKVYGGGYIGPANQKAAGLIDNILSGIETVGKHVGGKLRSVMGVESSIPRNRYLPEQSVKGIIKSLDANIDWASQEAQPANQALQSARVILDDLLKTQNTEYAKAMEPVNERMRVLTELKSRFGLQSVPGQGFQPGTTTEGALANVITKNKSVTRGTLERLKQYTGTDYPADIQNTRYAEQFQPGATRPNGSRRVAAASVIGGAIGKIFGSPTLGAAAGAGTGLLIDQQGGVIAAKIIDAYRNMQPAQRASNPAITNAGAALEQALSYGIPLDRAAQELQATSPDFRRVLLEFLPKKTSSIFNKAAQNPQVIESDGKRYVFNPGPLASLTAPAPEPTPFWQPPQKKKSRAITAAVRG